MLVYAALFAASVLAFSVGVALEPRVGDAGAGLIGVAVAVVGGTTCGWSWLLARALFASPSERRARWPRLLVAGMIATSLVVALAPHAAASAGVWGGVGRMAANAHGLASSAVLVLALIEPLRALSDPANGEDRRFRIGFAAGYGALLAVAVLWPREAGEGSVAAQMADEVKLAAAWLALVGAGLAVLHRRRTTREAAARPALNERPADAGGEDGLAARLAALMADERVTGDPDMKVPKIAARLRVPEYKVSRAIQALGFANFNQMINQHRLERAKAMLADPRLADRSILTIAMECGFGSIGPFNRAFKAHTAQTPSGFRRAAKVVSRAP
ncbi:MAG: AraC family transcriptional regulator [Alphaproteobacteria bacterium]|nr:AraC family transcriptional regulator [Alphaproteobacteria bacterium]